MVAKSRILAARAVFNALLHVLILGGLACLPLPGAAAAARIEARRDLIHIDGQPLFLKGIDYNPYLCGDSPGTANLRVDFRSDLRQMKENLYANTVRVYGPMPRAFYEAAREMKLWVIQGIHISDAGAAESPRGLLDPVYLEVQKATVRAVIDSIHAAGGHDVILAYAVGNSLPTSVVARTILANQDKPRFQGTHYKVPARNELPRMNVYPGCGPRNLEATYPDCEKEPGAAFPDPHPFQSFIAQLAEVARSHSRERGGLDHLVGHPITPLNSAFLDARDRAVPDLDLPVRLDFLDIIFENVQSYYPTYLPYYGYSRYLERLKTAYPDKPVVILETGYSTSNTPWELPAPLCGYQETQPQPLHLKFGGVSEAGQAEGLEARWVDVVTCRRPLAGFFVYEFYDQWWLTGQPDVQDDHPLEHFGLLRVSGSAADCRVTPKAAFFKVRDLFGCEEVTGDPERCGLVFRAPRLLAGQYEDELELPAIETAGGMGARRLRLAPGAGLPPGVQLDGESGQLLGKPERMGDFRFRLVAEDSSLPTPRSRERVFVLRVGPPQFTAVGREIHMNGQPFFLKGIDYSPFICGNAPWFLLDKADLKEDLRRIKEELHANTIRVYQSVPKKVYDEAREHGLFIIQGIHIQVNAGDDDLFEPAYHERTRQHVLCEVDQVHAVGGADTVLSWVVGNEISFRAQRETIKKHQGRPRYQGTYFSAPQAATPLPEITRFEGCEPPTDRYPDPHPFQSFVAEMVDLATAREVERYGMRHLMAHATEPNMSIVPDSKYRYDPLDHPGDHLPVDLGFLEIVFQNVYSYFPPYIRYYGYQRYLEECSVAYDKPFVVLECGYSTSPNHDPRVGGCATDAEDCHRLACGFPELPLEDSYCFGKNSEEEQARGIARYYREAVEAEVAGFFVFEYYDEWWKGSEHSEFCQDEDTVEEWFGLIAVNEKIGLDPARCSGPEGCVKRDRLAFRTVGNMFDPAFEERWCSGAALSCEVSGQEVTITAQGGEDVDALLLERDGEPLLDLKGKSPYTDRPGSGRHTYRLSAVKAFVECTPLSCAVEVESQEPEFLRGETNSDGRLDVADAITVFGYLFLGAGDLACPDAADANDDGLLDVSDPIAILSFLFQGGGSLPAPSAACGPDPQEDELAPCVYPAELCGG